MTRVGPHIHPSTALWPSPYFSLDDHISRFHGGTLAHGLPRSIPLMDSATRYAMYLWWATEHDHGMSARIAASVDAEYAKHESPPDESPWLGWRNLLPRFVQT